ncbi:MAG: phosphoglycerate kinase [Planctomycetaceae bacterium]|nr:phosphoglycerate kinase [Planctomycetaceae bacterium]
MTVTADRVLKLARVLKGFDRRENLTLHQYLSDIRRLDSLAKLPSGTSVLVRGDVDCKPGAELGQGDIRLRSMKDTLEYGRQRGWKQIIFGHLGRKEKDKPIGSLAKVANRIGQIINDCPVTLITNWFDEASGQVSDTVPFAIKNSGPGHLIVLENVRAYSLETVLWKADEAALAGLAPKLAALANSLAEKVASVYVNEALSAGSLDASTTIVPLAMQQVALGQYIAREFEGPMLDCQQAKLVVFSGIKIDKLDDLEAMIARGTIRTIFSAGSLAMALKKAEALLAGKDFSLGVSEDPAHKDKPYYIPPERIEQARRMFAAGKKQGIEFVLPVDFKLGDERVVETLQPGDQQFDIGPRTIALFEQKVGQFIEAHRGEKAVAFHNGVFGMFEDPRFETGTKAFIAQLKRMKDAGLAVYVGGGEGGTALEKYGQPDWVTHCFTAGGTVLNALGAEPVPYLVALRAAAKGS